MGKVLAKGRTQAKEGDGGTEDGVDIITEESGRMTKRSGIKRFKTDPL